MLIFSASFVKVPLPFIGVKCHLDDVDRPFSDEKCNDPLVWIAGAAVALAVYLPLSPYLCA